LVQRDDLVSATRKELQLRLTPEAMFRVNAHIQSEKRAMKVPIGSPQ
jgi:hypothetical protein